MIDARGHRRPSIVPAVFVVGFLSIQVSVPVMQLAKPRPARFGWHMYAGVRQPLAYRVVRSDGTKDPVNVREYLGNLRADLDRTADVLVPAICTRRPDAVAVEFAFPFERPRARPCLR